VHNHKLFFVIVRLFKVFGFKVNAKSIISLLVQLSIKKIYTNYVSPNANLYKIIWPHVLQYIQNIKGPKKLFKEQY
jgi:hypothetical protein